MDHLACLSASPIQTGSSLLNCGYDPRWVEFELHQVETAMVRTGMVQTITASTGLNQLEPSHFQPAVQTS
jgi:hypothetical protein